MSKQKAFQVVDVALGKISVNPAAQRELKPHRVKELYEELDLDMFGYPVLNWVNSDTYHVIDAQHRIEALKQFLGEGWEKATVKCKVYKSMSDKEEADMFDRLNNVLAVNALAKFKVRVTAQRETETEINRVVEREGLKISSRKLPGSLSAIGTLVRVFNRTDGATLGKVLRILRDSFGDSGFESTAIMGIGLLCERYGAKLDEASVVTRFQNLRGGINGLLGRAQVLHKQMGNSLGICVAAAATDVLNAGRGSKKLPTWWNTSEATQPKKTGKKNDAQLEMDAR